MTAPPEASSANEQPRYRAFLSYSHADTPAAARLHRWLETYRIPPRLVGLETPRGKVPRRLTLNDRRLIRRDGRPVWAEALRLDAASLARQTSPALLGGARALAVLALVARGAEDAQAPVLRALDEPGCSGGASGWDGRLIVRVLAAEGWPLRRQMARLIEILSGRALPRVWQMQGVTR